MPASVSEAGFFIICIFKHRTNCLTLNRAMKQNKTQRLLQLLVKLSGPKNYSAEELCQCFDCSERTIFRDLETIEASGFCVDRTNGYRLTGENAFTKSLKQLLHFSEEEATIIFQVLENMEVNTATSERLMKKLNAFYDLKTLEKLKRDNDLTKVEAINKSMAKKRTIVLEAYRSNHTNTVMDRKVEAFRFMPDYTAVWCYDVKSGSCKQFKISRIGKVVLLDGLHQHEHKHKVPFTDAFRIAAPKPKANVELLLNLRAYNLLTEEFPLTRQHIKIEENSYRLKIPVARFEGIGRFVMGLYPDDIRIVGPESFKRFIRQKVEACIAFEKKFPPTEFDSRC